MFLTRIERLILKSLNRGSLIADWEAICNKFSEDQARAAIGDLEDKGYITCYFAGKVPFLTELHLSGFAYKEIARKKSYNSFLSHFSHPCPLLL